MTNNARQAQTSLAIAIAHARNIPLDEAKKLAESILYTAKQDKKQDDEKDKANER